MTPEAQRLVSVIGRIRTCFNLLKGLADALHRDLGVTGSMRAVMEALDGESPQTVPRMARAKGVSRQHIQVIVDALVGAGLAALHDNPAHRRSPLVALTEAGSAAFAEIRRREERLLDALADGLSAADLEAAAAALAALEERLRALDGPTGDGV